MGKKRPVNVAASIAAQAKQSASNQAVVSISHKMPHRRVFFDGETLSVQLSSHRGKKKDLSNLLCQPKLALLLATGLARYAETVSEKTSAAVSTRLNGQIATFLNQFPSVIEPAEIDEAFWTAFLRFLNTPRSNGGPWHPKTRDAYLKSVKSCITALIGETPDENDPTYGSVARYLHDRSGFPHNPWPGSNTKRTPAASLQSHQLDAVIETCLGEIEAIRQRLDRDTSHLAQAHEILEASPADGLDYYNPYVCAAVIEKSIPDRLPSLSAIFNVDHWLGHRVKFNHGTSRIKAILFNTHRELVPFVLLLAAKTAINPDSLLSLTWAQVKRLPEDRILIAPEKKRSTTDQGEAYAADTDVPGGLDDILKLLKRLTKRTRELVKSTDIDFLFIAAPKWGYSSSEPKGFFSSAMNRGLAWTTALSNFITTHNLPAFTLKIFRPTAAEIIRENGGDALDVSRKLKHQNAQTQYTHYTSDRVRKRSRDKLAATQAQLIHWVETQGQVDPRGRGRWDRHSATRGFLCLDPRDSPRAGQKRSRFCTAYGECPDCPQAAAMPDDDYAVACYLSLRERIVEAKTGSLSGRSWLSIWQPVLAELDTILANVPNAVLRRASQLRVFMPPIG